MANLQRALRADLQAAGATPAVITALEESLGRHLPAQTYAIAIWLLGVATIILIVGAVVAPLLDKTTSEALWAAVGAGIGALAGIFTGKSA